MESAGFDSKMARLALKKYDADIMKAAEELLINGGMVLGMDFDESDGKENVYKLMLFKYMTLLC